MTAEITEEDPLFKLSFKLYLFSADKVFILIFI